jgi:ribose 5-phosphate isomerase B
MSADLLGEEAMERMVRTWLDTPFDGGRHARRLEKIAQYETDHDK